MVIVNSFDSDNIADVNKKVHNFVRDKASTYSVYLVTNEIIATRVIPYFKKF